MMCNEPKKVEITHELGCGWVVALAILAMAAVNIAAMFVKN